MKKTENVSLKALLNFTEKQDTARKAAFKYKYLLYGGAMGGGKSYWLRWMLVLFLIKWARAGFDGVEVGLFCEDYPALKDRHLSKTAKEFPTWLGEFHSDHKQHGKAFILKKEYGGGIIKFRNLDDPSKYQSAEFAAIAVDELTKNVFETFEDLRNRLRWVGIRDVHFISGTNPGGIGHAWVKRYWLDRDFPDDEGEREQFYYIPAFASDNPHISSEYLKTLESLSPEKRRAFLEGDWDIFKGQYFTEWRRQIHVCEPFNIPESWKLYIWGDYGYAAPACVHWAAISPEDVAYVYRELYVTEHTYSALTDAIIAATPANELRRLMYWVFDPAIWAKTGHAQSDAEVALSGQEIMRARYHQVMRELNKDLPAEALKYPTQLVMKKGNNDRINGWNAFREYLKPVLDQNGDVRAKIQYFPICTNAIRTIPSLVYDEHRVEDLDSDGEDHAADCDRYGIMDRPQPAISQKRIEDKYFEMRMRAKKLKRRGGKRPKLPNFN